MISSKNLFLVIFSTIISIQVSGQGLRVGDRMPEVEINNVMDWKTSQFKLSDFKDKFIILDFFGVHCSGCIAELPKMKELQQELSNQIQIILVTANTKDEVKWLKGKTSILDNLNLPIVIGDTILSNLFFTLELGLLPLNVIIDRNGIIKAVTNPRNSTAKHLKMLIEEDKVNMPAMKANFFSRFGTNQPLIAAGNGMFLESVLYYSSLLKAIDFRGGGGTLLIDSATHSICGVMCINSSISTLYQIAYGEGLTRFNENTNRTIFENLNESILKPPDDPVKYDKWMEKNSYCYEIRVSPSKSGKLFSFMQADLERYFGLIGDVQKRKVKCLALVRVSSKDKIRSNGGQMLIERNPEKTKIVIRNYSIDNLVKQLELINYKNGYPYFLDETNYKYKVDIELNANLTDIPSVRKALAKYGLDLIEVEREKEMLVIRKD